MKDTYNTIIIKWLLQTDMREGTAEGAVWRKQVIPVKASSTLQHVPATEYSLHHLSEHF